jgi:DNA polymerase-3 subunit epsilon
MSWHTGSLVAFDTETTGVDPTEARIVTATVVTIDPPARIHESNWLLDPGIEIPTAASDIHGITTNRARAEGQNAWTGIKEIAQAVSLVVRAGIPLIGYNVAYDLTVLDHELARHNLPAIEEFCGGPIRPVIDPLVIDRAVDRYRRGRRTLTAACEHYRVTLDGAHDASFDAVAAARLAWRLATTYPSQVGEVDPLELHDQQAAWHAEWAAHLQEHLRSSGKEPDAVVDPTWPLRHAAREVASA